MTFLPIVARELRVGARRRSTYRVRSLAALVVMLGGSWLFLVMHRATPLELGQNLFSILSGCAVFFGLVSGCFATADCLSEEKREGTLGLLFLTDLKGYDVVLGKLAANSLNAFYTVAAVVPLLAVPVMLGGLTSGDFVRMALVAVDALFLSLSIGIFVSSVCRSSSKAIGATFLLILTFTALLPAAGALLASHRQTSGDVPQVLLLPSAFYAYALAPDQVYQLWVGRFWVSLLVIHGLGLLFLVLASIITPRVWQDRPAGTQRLRRRERWRQWWCGAPAERAAFRRRLLNQNPFLWLAARFRYKSAAIWLGLALMLAGWFWGLAEYRRDWVMESWPYLLTGFSLHLFLRLRLAGEAPWQVAEERKAGTLELLLSTPLSVPEIVRGQRLSLQRQFLAPLLLVLAFDTVAMVAPAWLGGATPWTSAELWIWLAVWAGAMTLLVADFWTLFWVGLWQGLTAKSAQRATSNALGNLFMLPCVFYAVFLLWMVMGFAGGPPRQRWEPGPLTFFWPWFVPRLATNLFAGLYSREKVLTQFRQAAEIKRDPRRGLWEWLLATKLRNPKSEASPKAHAPFIR